MSSIKLPSVSSGMSTDDLANVVSKLIKEIQWVMDGNIDSVNAREIGGWIVGQDSLIATSGNVGLSSKITGGDDVRFWAGSANSSSAPTRIYNSGKIVTNNIQITGGTISWADMEGTIPDSKLAGAVNWNGKTTLLTPTGVYTGTLTANQINAVQGISLGANATIDWGYVNPDPKIATAQGTANTAQGTANNANGTANSALTTAQQIANGTYSGGTFISGSQIYSPSISGATITGSLFRTGVSGKRLEIDSTGLKSYNTSGSLEGVVIDSSSFSSVDFYYAGQFRGGIGQSAGVIQLTSTIGSIIIQAGNGQKTDFRGTVDFSNASVSGIKFI